MRFIACFKEGINFAWFRKAIKPPTLFQKSTSINVFLFRWSLNTTKTKRICLIEIHEKETIRGIIDEMRSAQRITKVPSISHTRPGVKKKRWVMYVLDNKDSIRIYPCKNVVLSYMWLVLHLLSILILKCNVYFIGVYMFTY